MPKYELIYFGVRGRAEVARLLFTAAGVPFEDTHLNREDWPKHKTEMPFGQVPVLVIDGSRYSQSVAIFTYLAREFGYHGSNNLEALAIDQIVQLLEDFFLACAKIIREPDEEKKEELRNKCNEEDVPKFLGYFCELLRNNGNSGFFVGNSLSLADISVYEFVNKLETTQMLSFVKEAHGKLGDKYPELQKLNDQVLSNEKIKNYVDGRKETMI